jgi:electron transport complex protein RnfB
MAGLLLSIMALCCIFAVSRFGARRPRERFRRQVATRIDALLPQAQCEKCGYPGCRPYADAIATGQANFNQCPPGGRATILALADLLGREPMDLNPAYGSERPPQVAVIDEDVCIGCTKCIQACPVDAIIGAAQQMHTIIEAHCTGCELCLPPCPVDCIGLRPIGDFQPASEPRAAVSGTNR